MLELRNICLSLEKDRIIEDISLQADKGEIICLLGPSGCGKSTLLRIIAGLIPVDSGSVIINGNVFSSNDRMVEPHKRDVGFLFQDFALFPHLTVAENIGYGLSHLKSDAARELVIKLLKQTRMNGHAEKFPHQLSGGEQQRVALARARATHPNLLLLDEPFSGLDAALRKELAEETRDTLKKTSSTALVVTHDPEEAMLIADRIILMRNGQIVQSGKPSDIYHRPINGFAARFLGEVTSFEGQVVDEKVKTPIGIFGATSIADGTIVEVLIRPDAIKITPEEKTANLLKICSIRDAGNSSLIKLAAGNPKQPHTHVKVRHRGTEKFSVGDTLGIDIDNEQVFVFEI